MLEVERLQFRKRDQANKEIITEISKKLKVKFKFCLNNFALQLTNFLNSQLKEELGMIREQSKT